MTVRSGDLRRPYPPVFLLGLHRTGSTWLHAMLARTGCFRVVTAHHVIDWDEYANGGCDRGPSRKRLAARFQKLGLTDRGIDAVEVSPDLPEEYGFILDQVGMSFKTRASNVVWLAELIDLLANEHGSDGRPLLKNPWDFGRAHVIKHFIPDAKFIYLHRHPAQVFDSMFRMVSSLIATPNKYLACLSERYAAAVATPLPLAVARWLFTGHPSLAARWIVWHLARETRRYLSSRAVISDQDCVDVKYESLCARPRETLGGLFSWLGVDPSFDQLGIEVSRHERTQSAVLPVVQELLAAKLSPYTREVGYDWNARSGQTRPE